MSDVRIQVSVEHQLRTQFRVLGVKVDATQIPEVVQQLDEWIRRRDACHMVAVTGMHGVMEAQHTAPFKEILNSADLVVPDGMPLVWIGRLRGFRLRRRVYGPELMLAVFAEGASKGHRHFFYGGSPEVTERLAARLQEAYPGNVITGSYSPPFRTLTPQENQAVIEMIHNAQPDIVWVGLSTPKQESWMHTNRERLRVPVLVGVGAAFDFNSGEKNQAPEWMREHGLEWLFRLLQEPRRLWRRYILGGSEFVFCVALELLGIKKF